MPTEVIPNLIAATPGGLATLVFLGGPVAGMIVWGIWRSVWIALLAGAGVVVAVLLISNQGYYLLIILAFAALGGAALGVLLKQRR